MKDIEFLLRGIVSEVDMKKICAQPENFVNLPLTHLGVDSIAVFEVLERIESRIGHQLDYDKLDYEDLITLEGLLRLLGPGSDGID